MAVAAVAVTQPGHEAEPRPGTIYSTGGVNTGLEADPAREAHCPMEAFCACGEMIALAKPARLGGGWRHTGRLPGDP